MPSQTAGKVSPILKLARAGEEFRFPVKDKGVGFPVGLAIGHSTTLGLQRVSGFARQLGGSLKIDSLPGDMHYQLIFPFERVHVSINVP